jgi:hypothetical protein
MVFPRTSRILVRNTVQPQSTCCRRKYYIENRLKIKLFIACKSLILKHKLALFGSKAKHGRLVNIHAVSP